jgi:hypothetical protein
MLISLTMKMKREADELSIILPFFSKVEWEWMTLNNSLIYILLLFSLDETSACPPFRTVFFAKHFHFRFWSDSTDWENPKFRSFFYSRKKEAAVWTVFLLNLAHAFYLLLWPKQLYFLVRESVRQKKVLLFVLSLSLSCVRFFFIQKVFLSFTFLCVSSQPDSSRDAWKRVLKNSLIR